MSPAEAAALRAQLAGLRLERDELARQLADALHRPPAPVAGQIELPLGLPAAGLGGVGLVDVVSVTLLEGYWVQLGWADGYRSAVNLEPYLWGQVGKPVRDPAVFATVQVDPDAGTLVSPATGLDISPVEPRRAGQVLGAAEPRC